MKSPESRAALRARMEKYPKDWAEVSLFVRARAGGRCECDGECGVGHAPRRCIERNGHQAVYAKGKVVLTVAHLWKGPCRPCHEKHEKCGLPSHLKAMCQRCHLRYDLEHHQENARRTRAAKKKQRLMF